MGLKVICYRDPEECGKHCQGWCEALDRRCEDIHADVYLPDGDKDV